MARARALGASAGSEWKNLAGEEHKPGCFKPGGSSPPCSCQERENQVAEYQTLIRLLARRSPSGVGSLPRFSPIKTKVEALRRQRRGRTRKGRSGRALGGKTLVSVPRAEGLLAPLQECNSIGVREHHPLGWPVEPDVNRTYAGRPRRGSAITGGDGIIGHDIGPGRIAG